MMIKQNDKSNENNGNRDSNDNSNKNNDTTTAFFTANIDNVYDDSIMIMKIITMVLLMQL